MGRTELLAIDANGAGGKYSLPAGGDLAADGARQRAHPVNGAPTMIGLETLAK